MIRDYIYKVTIEMPYLSIYHVKRNIAKHQEKVLDQIFKYEYFGVTVKLKKDYEWKGNKKKYFKSHILISTEFKESEEGYDTFNIEEYILKINEELRLAFGDTLTLKYTTIIIDKIPVPLLELYNEVTESERDYFDHDIIDIYHQLEYHKNVRSMIKSMIESGNNILDEFYQNNISTKTIYNINSLESQSYGYKTFSGTISYFDPKYRCVDHMINSYTESVIINPKPLQYEPGDIIEINGDILMIQYKYENSFYAIKEGLSDKFYETYGYYMDPYFIPNAYVSSPYRKEQDKLFIYCNMDYWYKNEANMRLVEKGPGVYTEPRKDPDYEPERSVYKYPFYQ